MRPAPSLILFALALLVGSPLAFAAPQDKPQSLPCKAELVLEPNSGDVLFESNADEPLAPASMVKMMVSYVTLKQIKEGNFTLDDVVTTSAFASKVGGSQVYLRQGEQFTLGQLLEAVLIQSANDAAVAIAEHVGGSRDGFVDLMNVEAKNLGLTHSEFHSPHGLPPGKDQSPDLMSARDLAKLGVALLRDFPEVLHLTGKSEGGFRDNTFNMRNHNHLVRTFPGCDGFKTGFYNKAGFGVTATAQRKGVRVIAVLMGCPRRPERDREAARLMTMGFSKFKSVVLAKKGEEAPQSVPVIDGRDKTLKPVVAEDVTGFVRVGNEKEVRREAKLCESLKAPLPEGTPCGHLAFLVGDKEIARAKLIVPKPVLQAELLDKIFRLIGR